MPIGPEGGAASGLRADCELELGFRARVPELLATPAETSPFLFGVIRPRIVVGEALLEQLDEAELRQYSPARLAHWKRGDTWIGWLQVLAQSIFWFHPCVWWASAARHERECLCDEMVLRLGSFRRGTMASRSSGC